MRSNRRHILYGAILMKSLPALDRLAALGLADVEVLGFFLLRGFFCFSGFFTAIVHPPFG